VGIDYVWLKFAHILIAIVALGTSAGLGILLEFYGSHPTHGAFVLRAIRRLLYLVVIPGYVLMLVTGLWLSHLAWPLTTRWIQFALGLWAIGAALLALSLAVIHRQIALFENGGGASAVYRRIAFWERLLGGGVGLVVVSILYFMVAKPAG
jgi:uncharacterized membrane protein